MISWVGQIQLLLALEVEVVFRGGEPQTMHARVATPAERAELWPIVTRDHRNYADYQSRTRREIPLVWLEPRP